MKGGQSLSRGTSLEVRASTAHQAYLDALLVWDEAHHQRASGRNGPSTAADEACEIARSEKERRRVIFRDLCDELGRVPESFGLVLPPEPND